MPISASAPAVASPSTPAVLPADIASQLQDIVERVAATLHAPVSSCYRWLPEEKLLQLEATRGLNRELVGNLRLQMHQGLTGLVAETRKPVSVKHPAKHPRYIFVPGSYEERLESYLGVPVFQPGRIFCGVLTVQSESPRIFTPAEISTVVMAASSVASLVAVL